MKIAIRVILLAIVLVGSFWLWQTLFPGPEKIIRKQMATLATTTTYSAKDSIIARGLKARKLGNFFAPDAQIVLDTPEFGSRSVGGRDDITEKAGMAFASIQSLLVEFVDVSVTLGADRQSAEVSCTAKVHVNDQKDLGVQELRLQFQKLDGHWLISRIETVKTLT